MQSCYDLKIRIYKSDYEGYKVEFRSADGESVSDQLPEFAFNMLKKRVNPGIYGSILFDWLFVGKVKEAFRSFQYLSSGSPEAKTADIKIRLLLELDPQLELGGQTVGRRRLKWETFHEQVTRGLGASLEMEGRPSSSFLLRWETLYDSVQKAPLALTTAFSRFVRSQIRGTCLVRERPLRMLVLASQPGGLERFSLAPFDSDPTAAIAELVERFAPNLAIVKRKMGSLALDQLQGEAGQGGFHIVHLLAHVVPLGEDGAILLADEGGNAFIAPFTSVVQALMSPSQGGPFLIFLATPSPGEQAQLLANLGAKLVEAGAQAVISILSPITGSEVHRFTDRFYQRLFQTGIVDAAVRDARAEIYDPNSWEWAAPVLYLGAPDAQLFQPLPESLNQKLKML
jgi:hypothetical protein